MSRPMVLALVAAAAGCARFDPVESRPPPSCAGLATGGWDPGTWLPGLGGEGAEVRALVPTPDGMVVGGVFDAAGPEDVRNVALWSQGRWSPMADGLPGEVLGMALDDAGRVWALGGAVRYELTHRYLARWDGDRWTTVAEELAQVFGVAPAPGGVAVYGNFTGLAGAPGAGLAVWDGASWVEHGLFPGSWIGAAGVVGGRLCAAGVFAAPVGVVPLHYGLACEEPGGWVAIGPPIAEVSTFARAPDGRWWVGGNLAIPDGADGVLRGLALLAEDGTWQVLDGGLIGIDGFFPHVSVSSIRFAGDAVVVAGAFRAAGRDRRPVAGVAGWRRDRGWYPLVEPGTLRWTGGPGAVEASVADGGRLHVAGNFATVGPVQAVDVATIEADGSVSAWAGGAGSLGTLGWIQAMAAGPGRVLVAGRVFAPDAGRLVPAAWFADGWQAAGPEPWPGWADATAAVVLADGTPVLAGERVVRGDDADWTTLLDDPSPGTPLLVDRDGRLYLGRRGAGSGTTEIVRWDDGALESLGTIDDELDGLAAFEGALVASGRRDQQDPDAPARLHVRWPDGDWQIVDDGPPGSIEDLTASPALGVVARSYGRGLVAWDGTWRDLPAGWFETVAGCDTGVVAAGFTGLAVVERDAVQVLSPEVGVGFPVLAVTDQGVLVGGIGERGSAVRRWRAGPSAHAAR